MTAPGVPTVQADRSGADDHIEDLNSLRQGPLSVASLRAIASDLRAEDPGTRQAAITTLATLPDDMVPAIAERIQQLKQAPLNRPQAIEVLERLIELAEPQADGSFTLTDGVAQALADDRTEGTATVVEVALLLGALERAETTAAGLCIADALDIADGAFRGELNRLQRRSGPWLLPALIRLRSDQRKTVKRWAQSSVYQRNAATPEQATNVVDAHLLAEIVTAYSQPLDFEAMPTIVRLTRNKHSQVRAAARDAVAQFGKNAIWQLRALYEELTGKPASATWKAPETAAQLYAVIDRTSIEAADTALATGLQHLLDGDLPAMAFQFDRVLTHAPEHPQRAQMAPGYAALADQLLADRAFAGAEDAYRVALQLANDQPDTRGYRAQLAFARAEHDLSRGVVDTTQYQQVLDLAPDHAGAREAMARLDGSKAAAMKRKKRIALSVALAMLGLASLLLLRFVLRPKTAETPAPPTDIG